MSCSTTPPSPEPSASGLDKRDWIAGLEKGLSIIEAFDDDDFSRFWLEEAK